jgi:hypothetical protein
MGYKNNTVDDTLVEVYMTITTVNMNSAASSSVLDRPDGSASFRYDQKRKESLREPVSLSILLFPSLLL